MKIAGGCALDEVPLPGLITTDEIDEQTNALVMNLMKQIGIQKSFIIRKADVKNMMVTKDDKGNRLLLINPSFLIELRGHQTDWFTYFVLAHEIAHFMNDDPLDKAKHNPEMEIAADKFAAVTLCRMGANIQDVRGAIELFVKDNASPTYPTKSQRLFGVESGLVDAKCGFDLTYEATTNKAVWKYAGKGFELGWGENNNRKYYDVCLKIVASSSELNRIEYVRYYFLHDSFGEGGGRGKIYSTATDASNRFQHCIQIWGTFPLRVTIYYKEGKQKVIDYEW